MKRTSILVAIFVGALAQSPFARGDDRKDAEPTADQQKNNHSDLDLTAKIRRSIMKDKGLSTSAHNVKIIAQGGIVTLKGPVRSEDEKVSVTQKAVEIAGEANVKCALEVKP